MKLLTKAITDVLPPLDTETTDDSLVFVKYFNPIGQGYWFGMTYEPEKRLFFGYVSLFGDHNDELGYFSLDELESLELPLGMSVERDLHFYPTTLKAIKERYTK